jgi:hypothetical protein
MVIRTMKAGVLALALAALAPAQAAPVTVAQTLGGIDSFGAAGDGSGNQAADPFFDSFLLGYGGAGDTDALVDSSALSFSLGALPSGTVTDARLVLRTGGFGYFGQASVYVNGQLAGLLSDGDNSNVLIDYFEESVHVDIFDLLAAGITLNANGDNTVTIDVLQLDAGLVDLGAVDYAVLQYTADAPGGAVPEPASLALAALGLAAAGAARRRAAR